MGRDFRKEFLVEAVCALAVRAANSFYDRQVKSLLKHDLWRDVKLYRLGLYVRPSRVMLFANVLEGPQALVFDNGFRSNSWCQWRSGPSYERHRGCISFEHGPAMEFVRAYNISKTS